MLTCRGLEGSSVLAPLQCSTVMHEFQYVTVIPGEAFHAEEGTACCPPCLASILESANCIIFWKCVFSKHPPNTSPKPCVMCMVLNRFPGLQMHTEHARKLYGLACRYGYVVFDSAKDASKAVHSCKEQLFVIGDHPEPVSVEVATMEVRDDHTTVACGPSHCDSGTHGQ